MIAPNVALVHERLTEIAGSEHVVAQLAVQWPDAQVHVPISRAEGIAPELVGRVVSSPVNKVYDALRHRSYAPVLPLVPFAFRHMDLGRPDVVITSHHAFAANVVHATDAPVIAYVHSPARWAWDKELRAGEADGFLGRAALTALSSIARRGERGAAPQLAAIVANSTAVAKRIEDWWGQSAVVVHPPVDTEYFYPSPDVAREDFFLLAGRLVPYKRPDIAIRAAEKAGVRLIVVGEGRYLEYCKTLAGPETTFLGRVDQPTLLDLHRRTRALLMPGLEDFGIVPVESMACGTPVIALGEGGALDSVVPGVTGELIPGGTDGNVISGFAAAMTSFDDSQYDSRVIRRHAENFSRSEFRRKMVVEVGKVV